MIVAMIIYVRPYDVGIDKRRHITCQVPTMEVWEYLNARKDELNVAIERIARGRSFQQMASDWNTTYSGAAQHALIRAYPDLKDMWPIRQYSQKLIDACTNRANAARPKDSTAKRFAQLELEVKMLKDRVHILETHQTV